MWVAGFLSMWNVNHSWDMQSIPIQCMIDTKFPNGREFGLMGAEDSTGMTLVSWGALTTLVCQKGQEMAPMAAMGSAMSPIPTGQCATQQACVVAIQNRCIVYKMFQYGGLGLLAGLIVGGALCVGGVIYMFTLEPKKKYLITTILLCAGAPVGIGICFAYVFVMQYGYDGLKAYEYYGPKPAVWISWYLSMGASCIAILGATVSILRMLATMKPKKNIMEDEDDEGEEAY